MSRLIDADAAIDAVLELNAENRVSWLDAVIDMLDEMPTAHPKKGKWISCEERLPEPMKAVLGYAPRWKNIFALFYDSAYGWMVWSPIGYDCFQNAQGDIVAWMPMPEYEEEQDD